METGLLKHSKRPGNGLFNHDASAGGGQRYLQLGQPLDGFQGPQDPQHTEGLDGLDIPALVGPAAWEGGAGTQKRSGDTITFGTRGWVLSELPPAHARRGDRGHVPQHRAAVTDVLLKESSAHLNTSPSMHTLVRNEK